MRIFGKDYALADVAPKFLDDKDQDVRRKACSDLGNLANDKVINPISDILKDKDQVYRHNECLKSLYTLWYDYPEHQHTSAAAYKASMDYLKQTPRSETFPPWTSVSHLKSINKDKIQAWKSKADYFNIDEIVAVMADLASDPSYHRMGRSEAILVIGAWGTKQDLKTLKKRLPLDSSNNPDLIITFIDEAMAKKDNE